MRNYERYTIDFTQKTEPGGTHEKPKLLAITSRERTGDSLVFHFKIGIYYQQMHINKVNKNGTVNLKFISVYCKATAKLGIDLKFLKIFPNFHKRTDEFTKLGGYFSCTKISSRSSMYYSFL
jgi:hypothetical protein